MRVAGLLADAPDRSQRVRLRREGEVLFRDQIDHLVIRQEIARVEIDPAGAVPDDHLAHRKSRDNVLPVLKQPFLHPPFVVVEDRAVGPQQPHHLGKAAALPADIGAVRHGVGVGGIALKERRLFPFAAAPVAHAVARTVAKIIGRRGDHRPEAAVRQPRHHIETVAVKQRAAGPAVAAQVAGGICVGQGGGRVCSGRAARCPEDGVKVVGCVRQNGPVDNIWIGHVFPPAWPGLSGMVPESPGIPRIRPENYRPGDTPLALRLR